MGGHVLSGVQQLGQEESRGMRLLNYYWSQALIANRHCLCMFFLTLWTFQDAEEFFHTHIIESKVWIESSLSVTCPGTATSSAPCHPPAAIQDCHRALQELWQRQLPWSSYPVKPGGPRNPVAGSESSPGTDWEHPAGAGPWDHGAFRAHV